MSHVAVVLAVRGAQHHVTPAHEQLLEEYYLFLERLRAKVRSTSQESLRRGRVLTLPKGVTDWYVPRGVGRPQWILENEADERGLHKLVAILHGLGIPTFLREQPQAEATKFFMQIHLPVRDANLVVDDAGKWNEFWAALRSGVSHFVVARMVETVAQLFGSKCPLQHMVAVFDASGYSPTENKWVLALRFSFIELAVRRSMVPRMREVLVELLEGAWQRQPKSGWAATLASGIGAGHQAVPSEGLDSQVATRLWERAVDMRPWQKGAQHCLVWCDSMQGDLLLPEQRPLVPLALLHVTVLSGMRLEIEPLGLAHELSESDWARLGSSWTKAFTHPEFCGANR